MARNQPFAQSLESCGGGYQTRTANTINMLTRHRDVLCKNCGCLWYLAEAD